VAEVVPPIPYKSQIANENGFISEPWSKWFRQMFLRVGGSDALSNAELAASLSSLQTSVDDNTTSLLGLQGSIVTTGANYDASVGDDLIILNGPSSAVTIYTAIGNLGRTISILHMGTSGSDKYLLSTVSGQFISGQPGGSYSLIQNGQLVSLKSNGANWDIVSNYTPQKFSSNQIISVLGSTTNPTKGTVVVDDLSWYLNGSMARIKISYRQSVSGTSGSGDYLFQMPSGLKIDTSALTAYSTIEGSGGFVTDNAIGTCLISNGTSSMSGMISAYGQDSFRFFGTDDSSSYCIGSANYHFGSANLTIMADFSVPILGATP
jgi:hypothetical protein